MGINVNISNNLYETLCISDKVSADMNAYAIHIESMSCNDAVVANIL